MKYLLTLLFAFACLFNVSYAQFSGGIKLGLTAGTPIGAMEKGAKGQPGLGTIGGILTEYRVTEKWGIGFELYYTQKKSSFNTPASVDEYDYLYYPPGPVDSIWLVAKFDGIVDGSFDNRYIQVPILGHYYFSDRFSLIAGPYFAYLLGGDISGTSTGEVTIHVGKIDVENQPFNESQHLETLDYGLATGARYKTNFGMIYDLRLTTGLRSVFKDTYPLADGVVRNIYLEFTAGYKFGIGGSGCDCPKF